MPGENKTEKNSPYLYSKLETSKKEEGKEVAKVEAKEEEVEKSLI